MGFGFSPRPRWERAAAAALPRRRPVSTPSPWPTASSTTCVAGYRTTPSASAVAPAIPLYGIRACCCGPRERHSDASRARLEDGLAAGDPFDEVLDSLLANQPTGGAAALLRVQRHPRATDRFGAFVAECKASIVPERFTASPGTRRTVAPRSWPTHATGASSGPTEAVKLIVKEVVPTASATSTTTGYDSFSTAA